MYDLVPHLAPHPLTQINITSQFVKKEQLIFSFIKYKESIIIQKYNIDKNKHFQKYEHDCQRNYETKPLIASLLIHRLGSHWQITSQMNSNPDADDEINDNKEDVDDQDDGDDIDDNDDIVGDKIVSLLFQFPPTVFIPITLLFQFPALHLPLLSNTLPS